MRKYEIVFILDVLDEQKTKEEIKELLERYNANFLKEDEMGMRKLAYKIKKRENAFYYIVQVELDPLVLKDINAEVKLNEKILKYMAILMKEKRITQGRGKQKLKRKPLDIKEPQKAVAEGKEETADSN